MLFLYTFIHSKTLSGNFHLSSFPPLHTSSFLFPPVRREPNLEEHNIDYMQFNQKNKGDELFAHPQRYYIEHFIRY